MFRNILWDLTGKFGMQIVSFILSIILTRLLSPTEYGIMGVVLVITAIAHVFLDLGFNRAIIVEPEVSNLQYSSIFYINLFVAFLLGLLCFGSAGLIAQFYKQDILKNILKIASFSFVINALNLVPATILYKRMKFKAISIQNIISAFLSGLIGVWMAYQGYGVWSLLTQTLSGSILLMLMNWIHVKWIPVLRFSWESIKPMWAYGSRLFISGLLDTVYVNIDKFIIARIFSPASLGYYTRAQNMDTIVRQFSAGSIVSTLFPHIANNKDNREIIAEIYKKYLHIILFISFGISGVMFLVAQDLFVFLFTAKWAYAAKLFQILAVMGFGWPVSSLMCSVISGVGNSKSFLKLEVIKKGLLLPVYLFGFFFGLEGFMIFLVVFSYIAVGVNAHYLSHEIEYTFINQIKDCFMYFLVTTLLTGILFFLLNNVHLPASSLAKMIIAVTLFSVFYIGIAFFLKFPGLNSILSLLKK